MPIDDLPSPADIATGIADTAFAFRGYNITNLGRTDELLAKEAYRPILLDELRRYGEVSSDILHRRIDLVARVEQKIPSTLDNYTESLALIVAVEIAQIRLLTQRHEVEFHRSKLALGYSLGELVALGCCGMFAPRRAPAGAAGLWPTIAQNWPATSPWVCCFLEARSLMSWMYSGFV